MTLYIATTNAGKLRDFAAAARRPGLDILPFPEMEKIAAAPEEEATFEANACEKAIYYSRRLPDEIVIADDSGLEVEALEWAPGVRSARYAADAGFPANGEYSIDERNNRFLLRQLSSTPQQQRGARYRCCLAAARDGRVLLTAEGTVEGEILTAPRGNGGFGYDPLFYLPELKSTMAEIDLETKERFSHRGNALRALLAGVEILR